MHRRKFENFLYIDRKILYITLSIVIISIFSLTIIYAALSTTLNINGNTEVIASSWDIYLDNVQLNSRSASKNLPTITTPNTASFTSDLTTPGDFYEFTIDVVNNGTIDAMIDSVTKTPELTDTQKKYLKYIVEYQNGEAITTKQLVKKKSFVRLKVRIEFRNDISPSELPTQEETLNLAFTVNYVQSDDTGTIVKDDGIQRYRIISGDLNTIGSEICISDECFYVISSDEDSVTMFAKYNLYVGNECSTDISSSCTSYGEKATGIQDSAMLGWIDDSNTVPRKGTITYSSTEYWSSTTSTYPAYVYNSNSSLYNYIENYKIYLESQGVNIEEARLIKVEELEVLGCSKSDLTCSGAPKWVYETSYWTGSAFSNNRIWDVYKDGSFEDSSYTLDFSYGVRPVIVISKSQF